MAATIGRSASFGASAVRAPMDQASLQRVRLAVNRGGIIFALLMTFLT